MQFYAGLGATQDLDTLAIQTELGWGSDQQK